MINTLMFGDSIELLKTIPNNYIHSIF